MTRRPLLVTVANLAIVSLLSVAAYVLIGANKNESSQNDPRSSAHTDETISSTAPEETVSPDETQIALEESISDTDKVLQGTENLDLEFPTLYQSDFQ